MKPIVTWILIADGARARVVENKGPGKGVEEVDGLGLSEDVPAGRDIYADRPGRAFDSAGQGRHAMERPSDPRKQAKHEFARNVAELLGKCEAKGRFDRLIVVAPPRALGDLRALLPKPVQDKVTGELPKDLTHAANADLPGHLADIAAL